MKSESFSSITPSSSAISAIVEMSSLLKIDSLFSPKPILVKSCKIQSKPVYLKTGSIDDNIIVLG